MQSLHHLLTYVVHNIDYMLKYPLSIYLAYLLDIELCSGVYSTEYFRVVLWSIQKSFIT